MGGIRFWRRWMKVLRAIGNFFKAILCLAYAGFFILCCYSWSSAGGEGGGLSMPVIGTPNISFAAGSFPADSTELTLVLQPGEVSLLDEFTALQSLDLSGSTCYDEFIPWIDKHPSVAVKYTVAFPGDVVAQWDAESLALPGMTSETAAQAAELLPYLPKLTSLDLGSQAAGASLLPADLAALQAVCPDAQLSYAFTLAGQEIRLTDEELDLSTLSHEEVEQAAQIVSAMSSLRAVDLGAEGENSLVWEDIGALQAANPNADFSYGFTLFDKSLNTTDEALDFNHITMDDGGAAVRSILPYMQNCNYLDMDFCGVSNEDMASIRDDFPNIKVVWRIWFANEYSVRTDVIKILASKPSVAGAVNDDEARVLQYCTDLKYLDLGHNECITDISFVNYMPNLEVLVIALNPLADISPLANCPHLEYIELNSTEVSDLTPLSGLKELRHLNLGNCPNVSDISPLYGLTELERLWLGCVDPVPVEQVAEMQAAAPNCVIDTTTLDPTQGGWRYADLNDKGWRTWALYGYFDFDLHPRYELLREQFGYEELAYSYKWLDPLYEPHD